LSYCFGAVVRRIEPSPKFRQQFGCPTDTAITLDHPLGRVLPIGRKMTRPRTLPIIDLNGAEHECLAEAFDTTYNVLILMCSIRALMASTIILPLSFKRFVDPDSAPAT
jgi:hypothetical protein